VPFQSRESSAKKCYILHVTYSVQPKVHFVADLFVEHTTLFSKTKGWTLFIFKFADKEQAQVMHLEKNNKIAHFDEKF